MRQLNVHLICCPNASRLMQFMFYIYLDLDDYKDVLVFLFLSRTEKQIFPITKKPVR